MGNQDRNLIDRLSEALTEVLPPQKTLIVASTDLSHMYSDQKARRMDQTVVNAINAFDDRRLLSEVEEGRAEMCGYGPAVVAMKVARQQGARNSKVLLYRNSGDITGNSREVVGYLSAVIY
jgi:AmmeMemoRadiSam system protein B